MSLRLSRIFVAGFSLLLTGIFAVPAWAQERTWISSEGKELEATLVSASDEDVTLRLKGGRETVVPISRLSKGDQDFLAHLKNQGLTFAVGKMPEETQADRQIDVEGGPRIFKTPHFEFETDQNVSKAFISEAARVYEGTYLAIQSLPLGLKLVPPDGKDRYRGLFMNDENFTSQLGNSIAAIPGQRVAGVYMPARRELLVPYSSLGAKMSGSQVTLRKTSDTSTLIHEITHQVMHEWLPLIPVWIAEGMSEYVAAIPYQNGRFEFKNAESGLKERLESKYDSRRVAIRMTRPSELIQRSSLPGVDEKIEKPAAIKVPPPLLPPAPENPEWGGSLREYRDAMLLIYYFIHLDRKEAPGAPVAAYLKLVDQAKNETDEFIAEFNKSVDDFEEKRKNYNEAVRVFNENLEKYRLEVNAYNTKIEKINTQISEGVPEAEREKIGAPPAEPAPPEELVVPEILKKSDKNSGPIDLVKIVRERANGALMRDRTPQQLDAAVLEAFTSIGIPLEMEH